MCGVHTAEAELLELELDSAALPGLTDFKASTQQQLVATHHNTTITQQRATNNALSQYNKVIMFVSSSNKLTPKKNTQINVPMRDILLLWYKCSV